MTHENFDMTSFGGVFLAISWPLSLLAMNMSHIPIALSSVASLLAIISYIIKIRKDLKNKV
jgi:hypothetical protein